jgi:hypothetical protein
MTSGYEEHEMPEENKKYFTDRHLTPGKLRRYPSVQAIFDEPLTHEELSILNRVGEALEHDLHTHPEDPDVEQSADAADDPGPKLKGYVFVVH